MRFVFSIVISTMLSFSRARGRFYISSLVFPPSIAVKNAKDLLNSKTRIESGEVSDLSLTSIPRGSVAETKGIKLVFDIFVFGVYILLSKFINFERVFVTDRQIFRNDS